MNLINRIKGMFSGREPQSTYVGLAPAEHKGKTSRDYIPERTGFSEPYDVNSIRYERDSKPINFMYDFDYLGKNWRVSASIPYAHLLKLMHRMDEGKRVHFAQPIHFRGDKFVISTGGFGFWDVPANYAILGYLQKHSEIEKPHIENVRNQRMENFKRSLELTAQKKQIDSELEQLAESLA